ncbi:MAG: MotA/TolQ/ExbB proton channel family protein [Candidatus Omnitrophica bacterium]|nr:MotA/TolQ/ExbB proton channel family protein [Candidatus Omnitrophota bacterium]MDD5737405.1 MotA/TolQ/ExbB proton channel family protein [Candidatus Omnitrophota bacterium]
MGKKLSNKNAVRIAGFIALVSVIVLVSFSAMAKDAEVVAGTKGMTFWQICVAGGWTMIFIGLCSVLGMALIIDLFISLRKQSMMPVDYVGAVKMAIKNGDMQGATNLGALRKGFLVNVVQAGIDKSGHDLQIIQDSMTIVGAKEAAGLLQKIGYLSSIGTISPMLGLLGTVLGMIQSFNVIAFEAGLGKPTLLAAGVSQALITTAFGLIVGIPVMAFFFYFRNKAQEIITDIEITTGEIALMLAGKLKG